MRPDASECICEDTRGCLGDPGVVADCQPCLDLHPADPCLRHIRDDAPCETFDELLDLWLAAPSLSPDRMCRELAAVIASLRPEGGDA